MEPLLPSDAHSLSEDPLATPMAYTQAIHSSVEAFRGEAMSGAQTETGGK